MQALHAANQAALGGPAGRHLDRGCRRAAAAAADVRRAPARAARCRSVVAASTAEPTISIAFVDKDGAKMEVDCPSGEQLRAAMMDNKIDLYTTWGKIWSCGGVGQCGTCIVKVDEGADLLSERTATEDKKLKGKPDSWRLACQTIVGDGANSGKVVISTKPQQ